MASSIPRLFRAVGLNGSRPFLKLRFNSNVYKSIRSPCQRSFATTATPPNTPRDFKTLAKKYGFPAFVTYTIISTADLLFWYALFSYYGADLSVLDPIKPYLQHLKNGMHSAKSHLASLVPSTQPKSTPHDLDSQLINVEKERDEVAHISIDTEKYPVFKPAMQLWDYMVHHVPASFILAFTVHKLMVPLRVMVTIPATPAVARWMQRWTWWKKRR